MIVLSVVGSLTSSLLQFFRINIRNFSVPDLLKNLLYLFCLSFPSMRLPIPEIRIRGYAADIFLNWRAYIFINPAQYFSTHACKLFLEMNSSKFSGSSGIIARSKTITGAWGSDDSVFRELFPKPVSIVEI